MTKDTDRHSEPVLTPEHKQLNPAERAPIEAANGLRQFDRLIKILDAYLEGTRQGRDVFVVRTSMLMELNRLAVDQLISNPGAYRQTPMKIRTSKGDAKHTPPRWEDVPELVDEMCDYVNRNSNQSAFHLAAYLLWRVNWIHPFTDGNGRTARAISYLVLCVRMRQRLPGDRTIPDFISDEKSAYYTGLEAADEAFARGRIDVSVWRRTCASYSSSRSRARRAPPTERPSWRRRRHPSETSTRLLRLSVFSPPRMLAVRGGGHGLPSQGLSWSRSSRAALQSHAAVKMLAASRRLNNHASVAVDSRGFKRATTTGSSSATVTAR